VQGFVSVEDGQVQGCQDNKGYYYKEAHPAANIKDNDQGNHEGDH
jgi:hypothetical protein